MDDPALNHKMSKARAGVDLADHTGPSSAYIAAANSQNKDLLGRWTELGLGPRKASEDSVVFEHILGHGGRLAHNVKDVLDSFRCSKASDLRIVEFGNLQHHSKRLRSIGVDRGAKYAKEFGLGILATLPLNWTY